MRMSVACIQNGARDKIIFVCILWIVYLYDSDLVSFLFYPNSLGTRGFIAVDCSLYFNKSNKIIQL